MIWDVGGHLNTGGTSVKSSSMVALRVGEGSAKVETSAGVGTDPEAVLTTQACNISCCSFIKRNKGKKPEALKRTKSEQSKF